MMSFNEIPEAREILKSIMPTLIVAAIALAILCPVLIIVAGLDIVKVIVFYSCSFALSVLFLFLKRWYMF